MADETEFENMLLAAAGRPRGSEGKRQNKRRALPTQESSSEEYDDYSDYDNTKHDQEGDMRKGKGSKMPVKKRLDKDERDKGEGSDSDLSFGNDLYKDDEDRKELENMSELQREMILHERAETRENFLYKLNRNTDHTSGKDFSEGPPSSRMRSSARESSKAGALSALVAKKRQRAENLDLKSKQQHSRRRHPEAPVADEEWGWESSRSHEEEEDEEDDDDEDDAASKGEIERSENEGGSDEGKRNGKQPPDKELIQSITIRRSRLFKWFMEPFFEDVIVGCLVKIGTAKTEAGKNEYKLFLVQSVDAKDPDKQYQFENRLTSKHLNCSNGDDTTSASWQMVRVSDQLPGDDEINAWLKVIEKCPGYGITIADAMKKRNALASVNTFVYSAATVKQMLHEKKQASIRPSNIALEKDRLLKELTLADSRGEIGEGQRLQGKLKDLEAYSLRLTLKNIKAERIEMMNKKNKIENFKNASELKPANPHAKAGEAGYDPFSRRWTRSQNYYKSDPPKAVKEDGEGFESNRRDGIGKAVVALETSDGISKLESGCGLLGKKETLYNLHNFDLPISLKALEQFKGAVGAARAFMERKRHLEARYDVQIDNNDGSRHNSTLTVNDYKRRRGLL
ncbi:hypothetical protein O6H91_Y293700 [Diphasiastrum complanatum]|nr:hypothetical protein O6H91_Y293700 [Diphasiastrum complanatum]